MKIMKTLIMLHGAPGVGKTTAAINLVNKILNKGFNVQYVPEWIKDHSNRNFKLNSLDGPAVVGNQMYELNHAITAGYEYIVSCSSPALCTFYANYYSNDSYTSLVPLVKEWQNKVIEMDYKIYSPFIYLSQEEYKNRFNKIGRYEDFKSCLNLQEEMIDYLDTHFDICHNLESTIQQLKELHE
jgi:hypothetical protein